MGGTYEDADAESAKIRINEKKKAREKDPDQFEPDVTKTHPSINDLPNSLRHGNLLEKLGGNDVPALIIGIVTGFLSVNVSVQNSLRSVLIHEVSRDALLSGAPTSEFLVSCLSLERHDLE